MPVIPFLPLFSGGRSRRRKGQEECLGELRVLEDTKGTSRGASEGWTATATLEAGLEDGAAGRQHAVEGTTPSYSDLTALSPALFPFRSLPTPAAQGDDPGEFKEPATRMMGPPVPREAAPDA